MPNSIRRLPEMGNTGGHIAAKAFVIAPVKGRNRWIFAGLGAGLITNFDENYKFSETFAVEPGYATVAGEFCFQCRCPRLTSH